MPGKNRDVNLNVTATEETGPAFNAVDRNIDQTQRKVDGFNTKKPTAELLRFSSVFTKSAKDGDSAMTTLQKAIDDTEARIAKIRKDAGGSGSNGIQLFGDLKNEQSNLRTLQNAFKAFSGEIEQTAESGKGIELNLTSAALAAAPLLLPVAAGSVLGVLAFGGVGVGILGQLKDPAVKVAAESFGQSVSASLTNATTAFGPQVVKSLGIAQTGVDNFIADLKPAFDSLAPETQKIAKDFTDGLAQAGPSLSKSIIAAEPDLEAVSRLIASLPGDIADFASGLTIGASGGARAVDDLDNSVKQLSGDLGTDLGAIAATYGQITKLSDAADKNAHQSTILGNVWDAAADNIKEFTNPIGFVSDAINNIGGVFGKSSKAVDTFDGSVNSLGVDTRGMAPVLVGVSNSVDYLGLAALTADPPVSAVGKSVQTLGEHAGTSDPAVLAVGKSVQSMGEHAGTSNLATQALGFSVTSLGEHAGTSDPKVLAVGQSMQSMGEHAGTSNLATQALGFSVQSMGEHSGTALAPTAAFGFAVQSMGEHSGTAIGQLDGATSAVQSLAPTAEQTAGAMNDLATSISAASSQALTLAGDQLAVAQSSADFTQALKDNGKGFDENTQKGRDNESALLGALGAVQKNYQAQVDAGTATFATTQKYDAQVDKLIDLAEKNGLAADKADDLRASLEKVAGSYTATVHIQVAESAAQAQLIARATGGHAAFGQGDYLSSDFAFGTRGGDGASSGARWSMPPAQIDVNNNLRSTLLLDGRVVADSYDRTRSHQRHAAKVGAL